MTAGKRNQDTRRFLDENGLCLTTVDAEACLAAFLSAMADGLAGREGALPMIPTFIDASHEVPVDEPVIVIDAGGTNLRVGLVTFGPDGEAAVQDFSVRPMPGTHGPISKDDFFDQFASLVRPFLNVSQRIGFCFSYPIELYPNRDGRLMFWSKEIDAPEIIGEMVGGNIVDRLTSGGCRPSITVLNDTVATLLAGMGAGHARGADGYVGFILGTGTNTAYVEDNDQISKRTDLSPDGFQPINVESGTFDRCPRGPLDLRFDATTQDPGSYPFEKMISGAYRGGLCQVLLQAGTEHGLFSTTAAKAIEDWQELSTVDVSRFLRDEGAGGPFLAGSLSEDDQRVAFDLCQAVVDRAARLSAVNMAAAVIKGRGGDDPSRPTCVNADGSTFHKEPGFQGKVERALKTLLDPRGLHGRIIETKNAPTIGAAVAGLMG